jgi:nitroreductase
MIRDTGAPLVLTTRAVRERIPDGAACLVCVEDLVPLAAAAPAGALPPAVSADHLAQHLHEAPVHVIPCIEGRVDQLPAVAQASVYGSILPAAWSFMLALRARGLGAAWTTLHLFFERDAAAVLGIPETITQVALFPVAHFLGTDFKPAQRLPAASRIHWDAWGTKRGA